MDYFGNIVGDEKHSDSDNFAGVHCGREENYSQCKESAHVCNDVVNLFIASVGQEEQSNSAQYPDKQITHVCVIITAYRPL